MLESESFTRAVWRVVGIVVVTVVALYLVILLRQPLTWIVIAGFIAIAVAAPITRVQRYVKSRGLATAIVYIGVILIPVAIGAIVVPPLVTEVNQLVRQLPVYVDDVERLVDQNATLNRIFADYDFAAELRKQASALVSGVGSAAGVLSAFGFALVNSVFALTTILILSIFIVAGGKGWVASFIASRPVAHRHHLEDAGAQISKAISGYVAGAVLQGVVAGVTAWLMLLVLGVPYPAALGLIVGLLDLVPTFGATIGAIIVGLVTLFTDFPVATIIWIAFSVIYQQVENSIIQPRIQSRSVNVEPIIVLISVLFGTTLFGVIGALLAIPAAATIQIVWREYRDYRAIIKGDADPYHPTPTDDDPPATPPATTPPPTTGPDAPPPATA